MPRILLFIFSMFCLRSLAQTPVGINEYITLKLDSLQKSNPGITVYTGFIKNGETHFQGFGPADKNNTPFDKHTLFEIGSISKTFTAYVLSALLIEKKIDENTSIVAYLPDSVQGNKELSVITFKNLLNHTSGLPRMPSNIANTMKNMLQPYENYTADHLFTYLLHDAKPAANTGKEEYSNLGFALCGFLAEKISGLQYTKLVEQYLLTPLQIEPPKNAIRCTGYFNNQPAEWWKMGLFYPAGGIQLTTGNLLTYVHSISQQTKLNRAATEIVTTQTVKVNEKVGVCRGWHTFQLPAEEVYWHNGGTYGFSTFCAFSKKTGDCVVVLVNQFNRNDLSDKLGMGIMKELCSGK